MDYGYRRNTAFDIKWAFCPTRFRPNIRFELSVEVSTSDWIRHQHSTIPQFNGRTHPSVQNAVAVITIRGNNSVSRDDIGDAVETAVRGCRSSVLHDHERRDLIGLAWEKVRAIFETHETLPPHVCSDLRLVCMARVEHRRIYVDDDDHRMLPAADSSFALLDKYEVGVDRGGGGCSICLDELNDGALRMPCLHVFHDGCIKEWLRTSHYCPLCRYQMPTQ